MCGGNKIKYVFITTCLLIISIANIFSLSQLQLIEFKGPVCIPIHVSGCPWKDGLDILRELYSGTCIIRNDFDST